MDGHYILGPSAFLARLLYPAFVVFATYNTSGYSYYHWVVDYPDDEIILKIACFGALGFAYYNITETSAVALQRTGMLFVAIAASAGALFAIDKEWIVVDSRDDLVNAMQCTLVFMMGVGLSYAHLHSRIGGVKIVEEGRNV
jgi:hypothetical protein